VPCNPTCCANCINPGKTATDAAETVEGEGRGQQGSALNGKGANIFANASSVLAMAAEEISLDDALEKEVANEVELWRMETSGAAFHKTLQESSNSRGLNGLASVRSASSDRQFSHFGGPFERDRSLSPPPRTQVSLHDRGGMGDGLRVGPESSAASSDSAVIQTEARADRFGMGMKPPARPRGSAGVHARTAGPMAGPAPNGDADAAAGGTSSLAAAADAAGGGPREQVALRGRSPLREDQQSRRHGDDEEDDGPLPVRLPAVGASSSGTAEEQSTTASAAAAAAAAEAAAATAAAAAAAAEAATSANGPACLGNGETASVSPQTLAGAGASQSSAVDRLADPRRAPVEPDEELSSSDESTFAGFIEDPLDRERTGEAQSWLGAPNVAASSPDFWDAARGTIATRDIEEGEDVRPDRSHF